MRRVSHCNFFRFAYWCFFLAIVSSQALAFNLNKPHSTRALLHKNIQCQMSKDFEDFTQYDADDGKDLAKEFYKQVKKREERSREASSMMNSKNANLNDDDATWEVKSPSKQKKFTGRQGEIDSSGTPSAGLFSSQNGSVTAFPVENRNPRRSTVYGSSDALSNRDRMMRDEINFMRVASNEGTIIIQGILVLLLLGFTLYVGSTGGITDGSDRFGALDGMVNEFNGLGENIDFSSLVNDDSTPVAEEVVKEGSLWL